MNDTTTVPQVGAVISYMPRYDHRRHYGVVMVMHTAQPIHGDGEEYIALEVDTDALRLEWGTTYSGNGTCLDPADVTVIDLPELRVGQVWSCGGVQYRLVSVASRFSANLIRLSGYGNINRFILAHPAWRLLREAPASE